MADKQTFELPAVDRIDGDELIHVVRDGNSRKATVDELRSVQTPFGASCVIQFVEEELVLSGAAVASSLDVPQGSVLFAVTTRVTQGITGATTFDVGINGEVAKFIAAHPTGLNTGRRGVITPTPIASDTPILVTANGGNFTAGKIIVTAFYMVFDGANPI